MANVTHDNRPEVLLCANDLPSNMCRILFVSRTGWLALSLRYLHQIEKPEEAFFKWLTRL